MAGCLILLVLAAVAAGLYQEQFRLHPAVMSAGLSLRREAAPPPSARLAKLDQIAVPNGWLAASPAEFFNPETLYEKIDGKADLYLASGFQGLESRRFQSMADAGLWFEVFLYDMKSPRNAYAVFSEQQREGAAPLDFAEYGYRADNALFFCQGPCYVELVGSSDEAVLLEAMRNWAREFALGTEAPAPELAELSAFPLENKATHWPRLQIQNGLGCEAIRNIFLAEYRVEGRDVTAFVTQQDSEAEAVKTLAAYDAFLKEEGAVEEPGFAVLPEARVRTLFWTWQMVWTRGRVVAGVHQAPERSIMETMAMALDRQLTEAAP